MLPFARPAPAADDPLSLLAACHDKVRRFAGMLERLPAHVEQHGMDAGTATSVRQILRYFDVAGPLHHQDEERDLFPLLRRHVPELAPVLAGLEQEHAALGAQWQVLRQQLQRLLVQPEALPDAGLCRKFAHQYCAHAAQEEAVPFAEAARCLDAGELLALSQAMVARRQAG
ncbi:hemerythrin domain-containing protein [Laribacter hongkongensis]|uniref:hemerythrin domain-containing protein n=1 Tax=Laribacter hongkongensis TaxID=168471 RepID=UPI001EFD7C9F|nr:hemerythrin domain-containing protein [Laribacter hongkongensis]MCG8992536.1 hemerythrin domain-containing protein [Laribacter hongkongensis]MCG9002634.1 hemerythrin domain-containing protein [Laribacter hongkongensis]MCG9005564.1 hemerythrin domain-containing protein [Laribacter hongkongensis]MCG9006816.1 hemerythrin domain-containing protein [Laribacter hongkongensis]MCG9015777.1 hemerythrin domain-containing protein [Laribacter hongkongensis]